MPGFITTVALNPAVDRTILVPGFMAGATNRVLSSRMDPGGKGINVARVAKALGASVQVVGFIGEGNGSPIVESLKQESIPAEFVTASGENRVNLKIIDPDTGGLTELNDNGFTVEEQHLRQFMTSFERALNATRVLVLAGSLPAGVPAAIYHDLVVMAKRAGVATIVDADGAAALEALKAGPTLIKPNQAEAERLLGSSLESDADIVHAASVLHARGPGMVAISHGARGAALVAPEGRWWATPPAIRAGSTVGAGDSMVAGFAVGLLGTLEPEKAFRLAIAAGAATASLEGTQLCTRDQVLALAPAVRVQVR